jgi:alpha-amylase
MVSEIGVGGFRLDAAQHISRSFLREFIYKSVTAHRRKTGRDPFIVAEVWTGEVGKQLTWLDGVTPSPDILVRVFDTPLLNNFARISADVCSHNPNADLRTILANPSGDPATTASLVKIRPAQAVTFVANHDTQAGQSMETYISPDLKAIFYAFILLRREGMPCVFWGDLYGTRGSRGEGPACQVPVPGFPGRTRSILPTLCLARKVFAYGEQRDYFDSADCIGWTRSGTWDMPGCVVVSSLGQGGREGCGRKRMWVENGGEERWVDLVSGQGVVVGVDGWGWFEVKGRGTGVWVRERDIEVGRWPVEFEGTESG